jgi:hypothetical protein
MMNRRQSSRNADRAHRRVLGKMHAAPKREAHPVITARELAQADGVLLGFPADAVRHDGGADEGVPRLHPRAGCGSRRPSPASSSPPARREAGRRPRRSRTTAWSSCPSGTRPAPACSAARTGRARSPAPTEPGRPATPSSPPGDLLRGRRKEAQQQGRDC